MRVQQILALILMILSACSESSDKDVTRKTSDSGIREPSDSDAEEKGGKSGSTLPANSQQNSKITTHNSDDQQTDQITTTSQDEESESEPGPKEFTKHIMFLSEEMTEPNFGGLAAADEMCTKLAADYNLPSDVWRAVMQDSKTKITDRIKIVKPVFNSKGEQVAADSASFWALDGKRNRGYTITGAECIPFLLACKFWSGAEDAIDPEDTCEDWTTTITDLGGGKNRVGITGVAHTGPGQTTVGYHWVSSGATPCSGKGYIMCISQKQ